MNVFIGRSESTRAGPDSCVGDLRAQRAKRSTDMTRDKMSGADAELARLRQECQRLATQVSAQASELALLRSRFASYETALRGSRVTVYTQDRNLCYTSISSPMLGRAVEDILGRCDEEILPPAAASAVIAVKQEVLASEHAKRAEVSIADGPDKRWHELHIEPLRNHAGEIVGLTCTSIDVTGRKEDEAHLRLLMRELTHRSKNLLAVIQGMARQTARHAGSIEGFLTQFGARVQALAASHDLLIRESWYGASLNELVRSQLASYIDRGAGQVTVEGPPVALKPEAAQNLGLALHEMLANAEKFGSLSVPDGHLMVSWVPHNGDALALEWRETLGPKVKPRRKRGFGSLVIERNLARATDAEVKMEFNPDGLCCRILIPASQIVATR